MRSETGVRIIDHRCIDAWLEDAGQFQKVERGVSHLAFLTRGFVLVRKGTGIAARCASVAGQVLCGRFLRCKRRVSRRSDAGFFAKLIGVSFNACPSHVEEHFQPLGLRQLRVDFDHDARSASANVRRGVTAVAAPEPKGQSKDPAWVDR